MTWGHGVPDFEPWTGDDGPSPFPDLTDPASRPESTPTRKEDHDH